MKRACKEEKGREEKRREKEIKNGAGITTLAVPPSLGSMTL